MTSTARPDILDLVTRHLLAVMALEELPGAPRSLRFDEDLGADSLDLVELVENVERDLRDGGHEVHLADDTLRSLTTVGEAVAAIERSLSEGHAG